MGNREIIIISRRSDSSTVANDLYNNYTAASTRQTHDDHPPTHAHGSPTLQMIWSVAAGETKIVLIGLCNQAMTTTTKCRVSSHSLIGTLGFL